MFAGSQTAPRSILLYYFPAWTKNGLELWELKPKVVEQEPERAPKALVSGYKGTLWTLTQYFETDLIG